MHQLKISRLVQSLVAAEKDHEIDFQVPVKPALLEGKGEELLKEAYRGLQGRGESPVLRQLKVPVKVGQHLLIYDDTNHFNRYRQNTLKSELYRVFQFSWHSGYLRMCRSHERECLLSGLQERVWTGPPLASNCFGTGEEPGILTGNGSPGWKLTAYNDLQYDLISRLQGYRLIRIPAYENLMIGGRLQRIDKLLLQPNEAALQAIGTWLIRKMN
ncbi:DUF7255 family protein [Cyclobacterium jeungdonense]|uniref:Uncharacterized protein n=1 Tax=Cyclobacterium jeungdonense TaxID=708087 RepID=A0ABT8CBU3_9BACT|nr:hypothetical protein [Cyclobacterium jeungdonense]MDN3689981.1 hypothetical protein [Cyclobacterium jeungdonense]